jgi:tRNA U55 pseudouridine synthase TruB
MIRRTAVGNFTLAESVTLEDLLDESRAWTEKLLTPAQMMRSLVTYAASDADSEALRYGKRIVVELDDVVLEQMINVVDTSGALIAVTEVEALGEASQVQLRPKRVLSAIN